MADSQRQANLSVIIPLYNHERYIDAALDSVLQQSTQPAEIIVIDDGSRDSSWEKVQLRAEQDTRIVTWSRPNQGAHVTINEAINHATGDYVAILNSDDIYHPERFALCLNALEENPGAAVVCTALSFIDGAGKTRRNKWYEQALKFYRQVDDLSLALINGNFLMTTSNLFIRREVFADLGLFANLRYAHDLDFLLRLIAHGREILLLEEPLLHYRMHATNTISEDVLRVKTEWAAVVASFLYQYSAQQDWSYLGRLAEITDRHNLSRLLFFFFLQFKRMETEPVGPDDFLEDDAFLKFMAETIR
jgi:glycosyltransferase involved in cell wall biosynthesis